MHIVIGLIVLGIVTVMFLMSRRVPSEPDAKQDFALSDVDQILKELDLPYVVMPMKSFSGLSIKKIEKHLKKKVGSVRFESGAGSKQTLQFQDFTISLQAVGLPSETTGEFGKLVDDLLDQHWWPNLYADLSSAAGLVLICADSKGVNRADMMGLLVEAIINSCPPALGAIWSASRAVSRDDLQHQLTQQESSALIHNWIAIHTHARSDGVVQGFTRGLADLDCVEFEALKAPENDFELRQRLEGLARYSLISGVHIFNGDTTGVDTLERIKLAKKPSELGNKGWVLQMTYLTQSIIEPWKK